MKPQFLAKSAMIAALYVVLTFVCSAFSFGAVQVRVAMGLELLSFFTPAGIIGCTLGTLLSNILFGGLGLIDAVVGTLTTAICCSLIYFAGISRCTVDQQLSKKKCWQIAWTLPIIPTAALVDVILVVTLNVPYVATFITLAIGNTIAMFIGFIVFSIIGKNETLINLIKK